jgi:hypothetical protein
MSHRPQIERLSPKTPVPFTTLEAFLGRLRAQAKSLMQPPPPGSHSLSDRYMMSELAPMEDDNVRRVAQRLLRVIDGLQARFSDMCAWRDADGPDLDDLVFLNGGPVQSSQVALVAKLRELSKAVESLKQHDYATAYHDAVRVQKPFRP